MGRLKHIIIPVFGLLVLLQPIGTPIAAAQQSMAPVSIPETIFIHANTAVLVSGETLYYKLYCRTGANTSGISKVAYAELIDSNQKPVFAQKLFLDHGTGQGDFFIPASLPSGNYKLIGYTRWMLNKPASLFQTDIVIVNPFQNPEKGISTTVVETAAPEMALARASQNVSLQLGKKVYAAREKIDLRILQNDRLNPGNYSLSIRKKDRLDQLGAPETVLEPTESTGNPSENSILPELRGEIITGKITNRNGAPAKGTVALSVPGKSWAFKLAKTDDSGKFIFNIDKECPNPEVIIQVVGTDRDNFEVQTDAAPTPNYGAFAFTKPFAIAPDMATAIEKRSVASQIRNAYYLKAADSTAKKPRTEAFYEPVAKEYVLDDFTRFPTFRETLIEVATLAYFTQKDNKYILHVRDFSMGREIPEPALVLVDGLFIQDINELFEYKARQIAKISIVQGTYYYGPKAFSGVISVTTRENDYVAKEKGNFMQKPAILRPTPKKQYFHQQYNGTDKNRIPDYRYQLLWEPQLTLEQDETPISAYTSDTSGTFEICLKGYTPDGKPVLLKETFEVK